MTSDKYQALRDAVAKYIKDDRPDVIFGPSIVVGARTIGALLAERDALLNACEQALYALKGREHDGFLRAAIDAAKGKS